MVEDLATIRGTGHLATASDREDARRVGFYAVPGEGDGRLLPWDVPTAASAARLAGRPVPRLPDTWLIAKFHERYPGLYYKWGRGWCTTDGTIPHRLFLILMEGIAALEAGNTIRAANSVALGEALAKAGDKPDVQRAAHAIIQTAFPERYD